MLTEELHTAARTLGETLHTSDVVQKYLSALADCKADPEAAALEAAQGIIVDQKEKLH
jgi:hypothetical protein